MLPWPNFDDVDHPAHPAQHATHESSLWIVTWVGEMSVSVTIFSSAVFFSGLRETLQTSEMDRYDQYELINTENFEIGWKFAEIGWF